jgi:hypothetical protein
MHPLGQADYAPEIRKLNVWLGQATELSFGGALRSSLSVSQSVCFAVDEIRRGC